MIGGVSEKTRSTWILERSAGEKLDGKGETTTPEGKKVSLSIYGTIRNLLIIDDPFTQSCSYHISKISIINAAGKAHCSTSGAFSWTATIENPTDMTAPVLLKDYKDPRLTDAYKLLSKADKSKLNDEVEKFIWDTSSKSYYINIRDMKCLADQFLNVKMQKPRWTEQDVFEVIQLNCVVPDLVYKQQLLTCRETIGKTTLSSPGKLIQIYARASQSTIQKNLSLT